MQEFTHDQRVSLWVLYKLLVSHIIFRSIVSCPVVEFQPTTPRNHTIVCLRALNGEPSGAPEICSYDLLFGEQDAPA